ncbi:LOW QUALITY PROTEIN: hypothetical protein RJ639_043939 [Escallonia herrerae]|uniref:EamA domain-containing protein n=1 Tax=Escallonia herrerae TaxID=1293975 RepID=A0AA88WBJ1_9ASTE|nr:LOW QUALITY PROTEIN: hypothetical protein RJ639_043939 [Escallonia herrerae]
MNCFQEWKLVLAMVTVDLALAIVNILLKKVLSEGLNHLIIIIYRQSISTILLTPIAYFWERNSRPKLTAQMLCHLFLTALVGATLTQYLFLLGLKYTSATFTCAFINMVPVNTFIMALPFGSEELYPFCYIDKDSLRAVMHARESLREKSGRAKVLGALVSAGGALVLTFYRGMPLIPRGATAVVLKANHGAGSTQRWASGSIVLTAGSLVWSSWFLIQARIGRTFPCQYSSTAIMSFFSAIQSAILHLVIDRKNNISAWILTGKLEMLSVVYAGMVGSGLCYVVMSWCVKRRGPVFTSAFSPFIQIFVAVFDISVLHEQIQLGSVLGSILVIVGMYILLWGKGNEAAEDCKHLQMEAENGDRDLNRVRTFGIPPRQCSGTILLGQNCVRSEGTLLEQSVRVQFCSGRIAFGHLTLCSGKVFGNLFARAESYSTSGHSARAECLGTILLGAESCSAIWHSTPAVFRHNFARAECSGTILLGQNRVRPFGTLLG